MRLIAAILCFSFFSAAASEPAIRLRLGAAGPRDGLKADMAHTLASEIAAATGDRITVDVVMDPGPQGANDLYANQRGGAVDLSLIESWVMGANIPQLAVLGQPFLFPDERQAGSFFRGDGGARVVELLEQAGIKVAGWVTTGPSSLFGTRELTSPADFAGVRIAASPNRMVTAVFGILGSAAAPMPVSQRITALRSGQVDEIEGYFADTVYQGYPEEVTHISLTNHYINYMAVCYSPSILNRIPKELHQGFLDGIVRGTVAADELAARANAEAMEMFGAKEVAFDAPDRQALLDSVQSTVASMRTGVDQVVMTEAEKLSEPMIFY